MIKTRAGVTLGILLTGVIVFGPGYGQAGQPIVASVMADATTTPQTTPSPTGPSTPVQVNGVGPTHSALAASYNNIAIDGYGEPSTSNTGTGGWWLDNTYNPPAIDSANFNTQLNSPSASYVTSLRLGDNEGLIGDPPGVSSLLKEAPTGTAGTASSNVDWTENGMLYECPGVAPGAACGGVKQLVSAKGKEPVTPIVNFAVGGGGGNVHAWKQVTPGSTNYEDCVSTQAISSTTSYTCNGALDTGTTISIAGSYVLWDTGSGIQICDSNITLGTTGACDKSVALGGPTGFSDFAAQVVTAATSSAEPEIELAYMSIADGTHWSLKLDTYVCSQCGSLNNFSWTKGATQTLDPAPCVPPPPATPGGTPAPSPTPSCTPGSSPPPNLGIPLQVRLSKAAIAANNFYVEYSFLSLDNSRDLNVGTVRAIAAGGANAANPTNLVTGVDNIGSLDMEGSNAVWHHTSGSQKGYVIGYADLNTLVDNDNALTPPSGGRGRWDHRLDLVNSANHAAFLDNTTIAGISVNRAGASRLGYVDNVALQPSEKIIVEGNPIGNDSTGHPVYTCGTGTSQAPNAGGLPGCIRGPLSMDNTLVGFQGRSYEATATPATANFSYTEVVDGSAGACPNCARPTVLDKGDQTAGTMVTSPILSGVPGQESATWIKSDPFGGSATIYTQPVRSTAPPHAIFSSPGTVGTLGYCPGAIDLGESIPGVTVPQNTTFPQPQISGGCLAVGGQNVFVAATQSTAGLGDQIFEIPIAGAAPGVQPIYTSASGIRITAISSDNFYIAWIERSVNSDGTLGSGKGYWAPVPNTGSGQNTIPAATIKLLSPSTPAGNPFPMAGRDFVTVADKSVVWSECSAATACPNVPSNLPTVYYKNLLQNTTAVAVSQNALAAINPTLSVNTNGQQDNILWLGYDTTSAQRSGDALFYSVVNTNCVVNCNPGGPSPVNGGSANPGAYIVDAIGGIHQAGNNVTPVNMPDYPLYNGTRDIARGIITTSQGDQGYVMDGYGRLHIFGPQGGPYPPPLNVSGDWEPGTPTGGPNGFDIARGFALIPGSDDRGYTLDGYGFLHPFAQYAALYPPTDIVYAQTWGPTFNPDGSVAQPAWDIARGVVINPPVAGAQPNVTCYSGYILDGYGGLQPWYESNPACSPLPYAKTNDYFGFDIARGVSMAPPTYWDGSNRPGSNGPTDPLHLVPMGFVLDGYGGVHCWSRDPASDGTCPLSDNMNYTDYWGDPNFGGHADHPNWDIVRGMVMVSADVGYTLDGYGGLHLFYVFKRFLDPSNNVNKLGTLPPTVPTLQDYWAPGTPDGGQNGEDIARGASSCNAVPPGTNTPQGQPVPFAGQAQSAGKRFY
ncbi:MAG: hypothetical protein ACYDAY_09045 [Candidatus Dormibacteria bacterium]